MPHIFAQTDWDAYFAQGFCEAQDRLFQMDMLRRVVRGRLSEVLGERVVPLDKLFRTLTAVKTLEEFARDLPEEVRASLEAYAAGVNHYLEKRNGSLPVEFLLLGVQPEPWQPADCLAVRVSMAWGLNTTMSMEMLRFAVLEKLGPELTAEIFVDYPAGSPLIVPDQALPPGDKLGLLRLLHQAEILPGLPSCGASNAWVLAGSKTKSGKPLLANDMHLAHSSPSIWYEIHIHTPSHNVSGVTFAGMPLVVAGANQHVAWGFTNAMVDDSDYYIEKVHPTRPNQYQFKSDWEKMTIRQQVLQVRDAPDLPFRVRLTRHGPVISDLGYSEPVPGAPVGVKWNRPHTVLSVRWTANELFDEPAALYLLNRARSVEEVEQAAAHFKTPGQNWVYADSQGHIGYLAAMGIPRREGFNGMLPLPGWDGEHEWNGYVATAEQPHLKDPPNGWIATANNKMVGDDFPYPISYYFATPDRAARIGQLLRAKDKLDRDDMSRIQADLYVLLADELVPVIQRELQGQTLNERERRALALLVDWNRVASPDQPAPCLFHAWLNRLIENLFRNRLGDELYRQYVNGKNIYNVHNVVRTLLRKGESVWFDDPATPEREKPADLIRKSLAGALDDLEDRLGADPKAWRWGDLQTVTFYHPFGRFSRVLGWFFNVGPYPLGGSHSTVNPAPYLLSKPFEVYAGASQRSILDLADIENSRRIIPSGISGNFMSRHYDDQTDSWLAGKTRPFTLDRETVELDQAHLLVLRPE